ncbi:hypothetical protein KKF70_03165 [bacterium]|nr:hypothetical protein [Candidatus Omnitrophota bacterium]MBU2528369.1 hypothetical protein [bacterium]MBU3930627.1 hypothetical protein [bacterium]
MKFYHVFIIGLILLSATFISRSNAAGDSKLLWVAVTVFDGRNNKSFPEYYGQINQKSVDTLTTKTQEFQMFKLENIFWVNDEGETEKLSDSKKHGRLRGYTDTAYFRSDQIYRIVFLDEDYVTKLLNNVK